MSEGVRLPVRPSRCPCHYTHSINVNTCHSKLESAEVMYTFLTFGVLMDDCEMYLHLSHGAMSNLMLQKRAMQCNSSTNQSSCKSSSDYWWCCGSTKPKPTLGRNHLLLCTPSYTSFIVLIFETKFEMKIWMRYRMWMRVSRGIPDARGEYLTDESIHSLHWYQMWIKPYTQIYLCRLERIEIFGWSRGIQML